MELSLSMWSLHRTVRENQWTVMDFLSFCKEEGIQSVELLNVFWKNQEQELDQVLRYTSERGIKVVSYAVANDFVNEDPEKRADALKEITDAIPVAKALGTSIIRVFSGNLAPGLTMETAQDWIVDGLSAAAKQAEQARVTLCLENHGQLAGRGEQVKHIIDTVGSEALRSTFDTGNFLLVDEHPSQSIQVLIPFIAHVHFKDFTEHPEGRYKSLGGKAYEGIVAGQGDTKLESLIQLLQQNGYQGAYVLEYEGLGSEAEGVRKSYEFVRQYNLKHGVRA
ncbi:sugar phosphate isomerase/epimerase family protein [Paenibacillus abyssi]|uniref:Sugar phosphate isomerase n=1 Tax=Paenibacillus abyssi TaxID=1340531 RepID=A0A917CP39_9BACL|nr:sugar phosphate isomerase/epimerase family protein [Paenibacillus abyssi]GGF94482.1 sugar phosphate isomerase [Paenibacillus abyssi]